MCVNLEARNLHLLGTQLISRVIEKRNIILPKRGGNFQITLKNGGLILILILIFFFFFFAIPFYFMGSTMCVFHSY